MNLDIIFFKIFLVKFEKKNEKKMFMFGYLNSLNVMCWVFFLYYVYLKVNVVYF